MKTRSSQNYEHGRVAVDAVIFTINNQKLSVYLSSRREDPYKNWPELPGGLLLAGETAEETLARKLGDVIGTRNIFFQQFHTFTRPERDPRGRTVSIGFVALLPQDNITAAGNFCPIDSLPRLAFDHRDIIERAIEFLKQNIDNQIVNQFMPELFPLNGLQMVHEVIQQRKLDNRNFRKKILSSGTVKKVSKIQKNVAHRPANLYQFVAKR